MSARGHNKRRNTGLLYEFLVRAISQALVDGDTKKSNAALKVIRRHFKSGTELYKEFRLINALVRTTVSSEAIAASIVQEAKLAARSHDTVTLDREKSLLISVINRSLSDDRFFDRQVNEYKVFATVQTLLNDWRVPTDDLGRTAQYEDQLARHLVTPKPVEVDEGLSDDGAGSNRLLMKVLMQKLNEKYAGALSSDQKQLLRAYAFSTINDDSGSVKVKLQEIKQRLLQEIDAFGAGDPRLGDKLTEARQQINAEELGTIDDGTVTRFMLYTKLHDELTTRDT